MFEIAVTSKVTPNTFHIVTDEKYLHLNTDKSKLIKSAFVFEGVQSTKCKTLTN